MNATMNRLMSELDRLIEIRDELASDIARMGRTGRFGSIDCQDRVKALETIGAQVRRVVEALDACEEQDGGSEAEPPMADVTGSTTVADNLDRNDEQYRRNEQYKPHNPDQDNDDDTTDWLDENGDNVKRIERQASRPTMARTLPGFFRGTHKERTMNAEQIREQIRSAVEAIGCTLHKYDGRRFVAVVVCHDGRVRNIFTWKGITRDHLARTITTLYD